MIGRMLPYAIVLVLLGLWATKCGHRPGLLPLATDVDGPPPARASSVLFMLHGHGGDIGSTEWIRPELRQRGVGADVSLVMVDGPFSEGTGRSWGVEASEREESLRRVRALLAETRRDNPGALVVVAGFSRGADLALRVAANAPEVGAVVAFAPCDPEDVPRLAERADVATTLVHATNDRICGVRASQGVSSALRAAGRTVALVEHAADHTIPPTGLDALARVLTGAAP